MKKLFALILAITMLFSLAACSKNKENASADGNTESINGATGATISSVGGTQNTPNGTTGGNSATQTNPDGTTSTPTEGFSTPTQGSGSTPSQGSGSTPSQGSTTPTQGSTTTSTSCSHSYKAATCTTPKTCSKCGTTEGSVAAHNWQEATCSAAKTCSVCKKTEGNKAEHVLNADKVCKWCKQVVAVNPSNFNPNIDYTHLSKRYTGADFGLGGEFQNVDSYVWTHLNFQNETYKLSSQSGVYSESNSPVDGTGYTLPHHHNGKYYYNIAQASWFGGETTYQIVGNEIVAYFAGEGEETANTIHFLVMSDGTLKVTAVYGYVLPEKAKIPVGAIFYPNSNPFPQMQ